MATSGSLLLKVDGILPTCASLAFGAAFVAFAGLALTEEIAPGLAETLLLASCSWWMHHSGYAEPLAAQILDWRC